MAYGTLNVGVLTAGDASLSVTLGTNAGNDFSVGDTKLVSVGAGGDLATSTTGKIKQKGSAFQSHITASLALRS